MKRLLILGLVSLFLLLAGCAAANHGVSIPADMEITRLAEILENPPAFNGQNVLLEGVVGIGCLSCPDFPYQEGVNTIQLYVEGFSRPNLQTGQPVRVYAAVKAGEERVVITALALEVK